MNSICRKPPGTACRLSIAARQLEDPDGRIFAVVTFTDITEQKSAEIDLRRANLLLEARERAMEEDLLLAARVQQSLAPRSLAWGAASVETYYQAARTIGGDYGLVTPGDDYLTLMLWRCFGARDWLGAGRQQNLHRNRFADRGRRGTHADVPTSQPIRPACTWEVLSCTSLWPPHD